MWNNKCGLNKFYDVNTDAAGSTYAWNAYAITFSVLSHQS